MKILYGERIVFERSLRMRSFSRIAVEASEQLKRGLSSASVQGKVTKRQFDQIWAQIEALQTTILEQFPDANDVSFSENSVQIIKNKKARRKGQEEDIAS